MSRRVNGKVFQRGSYQTRLREAISRYLPHGGLATLSDDSRVRWVPRLLVVCAILMSWGSGSTLVERFGVAREAVVGMFPGRRRPGQSYAGFISALAKVSDELVSLVMGSLRGSVRTLAEAQGCWLTEGWAVFGADGSKIDCPMTEANENGLGLGCKSNSWPQLLLTMLFHVGTGVPWGFVRGGGRECERQHLISMLGLLPKGAMVTADAGFPGYELFRAIAGAGCELLIRAGGNVKLLTNLGWVVKEYDGLVYLWPDAKQTQGQPPIVLRLIKLVDGRNRVVCLLTTVMETDRLSDASAMKIYTRRWLVELLFRSLKQTMGRRKMLSDSPNNAKVELDWSVVGLWLLSLMTAEAAGTTNRLAIAPAWRAVRSAMAGRGPDLRQTLARCRGDTYTRTGSKKARHWPQRAKHKFPSPPQARTATKEEIALAKEVRRKRLSQSFTA